MFKALICLVAAHEPDRRRVKKTPPDDRYRGYCRRCGAHIVRQKRDNWTRDWLWRFRRF